jgi:soluble lytic murein transglycosylase
MRGIGSTFSRLPKVAAWVAGAALLAGTLAPRAFAQGDETAMAVPRLAPFDAEGVALPQPLAKPDAALLRRLFADMRAPIPDLVREARGLDASVALNDQLLGVVLAERYLGPGHHSSAAELSLWLKRYTRLPQAVAIAALLHQRDPKAELPSDLPTLVAAAPVPEEDPPADASFKRSDRLDRRIGALLRDGKFDAATRMIAGSRGLSAAYAATLRAEVAQGMFTHNRDREALALARQAVAQSKGSVGLADFIAGLAAWRLGERAPALIHFAAAARAPIAAPALHAAGAYWAARASLATGDDTHWRGWLDDASAQRRTFYGQIAARIVGRSDGLEFATEVLGEADLDAVAAEPGGLRAFALLQIGQTPLAETELRLLAHERPPLARSVMLIAERAGLFDVAADLAARIEQRTGGTALDADRFPVPRLRPGHGFMMDPALVYALTRIESNFDSHAVSPVGAEGLMQLMPHTAGALTHGVPRLHDPSVNLDLGQKYVSYLAGQSAVKGDLISLLASYNAGPVAFGRWSGDIRDFNDPLLFIEAIPTDETRRFVQRALAYTWIYAARLHLPTPSLDALAAGHFPLFSSGQAQLQVAVLH